MTTMLPIALLALQAVATRGPATPNPDRRTIEHWLLGEMRERRIPGMQVVVLQHGTIVFQGAWGLASIQHRVPVTDKTVFSINSATKAFTGVALMQLVEAGKLDLDQPIGRYVANLPAAWAGVSVRHLVNHTSGLPDVLDKGTGELIARTGDSPPWVRIKDRPVEFQPGERVSYNQTNYVLLGQLIDTLTGRSAVEFMTERQLRPAGMTRTGFGDTRDVTTDRAEPYRYVGDGRGDVLQTMHEEFPPFMRTAAGINSTALDVARWLRALRGTLLQPASLETLWEPGMLNDGRPNSWAIGWPAFSRPSHRAVSGIGGARSAFFVYPDDDLAIVILTNLLGGNPEQLMDRLAGFYLPDLHPKGWDAIPVLRERLEQVGFDQAVRLVTEARREDSTYTLAEADVRAWGARLMSKGEYGRAVEIFKVNVALHGESAAVHVALGEAYEAAGDRGAAVASYRRALAIDAANARAAARLKALEGTSAVPPGRG